MLEPEELPLRIEELENLPVDDLETEWKAVFGRLPPDQASRRWLVCNLAWQLQLKAYGGQRPGVDDRLSKIAAAIARNADDPVQTTRPAVRPGTKLLREWQGVTHEVVAAEDGFTWNDRHFKSLSSIALEITGTRWSGPVFFGLKTRNDKRGNHRPVQPSGRASTQLAG